MANIKGTSLFDRRDEIILLSVAVITALMVVPALLGYL